MSKVCVLLSTYNGQTYLEDQLHSIYTQIFDGNIIVMARDDGSSDNTLNILTDWKTKLNMTIIKGHNIGPKASFFELVKQAPLSDYYAFCDQDDVWQPYKIASGVSQLLRMSKNKPNLYFSNAEFVDEQLKPYDKLLHKSEPNYTLAGAMVCNPVLGCATIFNSHLMEIVRKVHPVNTSMHDKFFLLTAILLGNIAYDHTVHLKYRQHNLNVCGHQGSFMKRIMQSINLWFKSKQTSLDKQAKELLNFYGDRISDSHKSDLYLFAEYKRSIGNKFKLIQHRDTITTQHGANRSFIIRTILNLA